MFLAIKKCLWLTSRWWEIIHRHIGYFEQFKLEKFVKYFFGRVRIHFSLKKIDGIAILFFTRFMPTNGFIQPFVGIISFLSVKDGTPRGIRTPDLLVRSQSLYPAELLAHKNQFTFYNNILYTFKKLLSSFLKKFYKKFYIFIYM